MKYSAKKYTKTKHYEKVKKYAKKGNSAKKLQNATMGKLVQNHFTKSILPDKLRTVYSLSVDAYITNGVSVSTASVQINSPYLPLQASTNTAHTTFTNFWPLVASQSTTMISPLNYSKYSTQTLYNRLKVYGFSYELEFMPAGATSDNLYVVCWINDIGTYPFVNASTTNQPLDQILSNPLSQKMFVSMGTSGKGNKIKGYVSLEKVYGLTKDQFFNNQQYTQTTGSPSGLIIFNQALTQDQLVALNFFVGTVDGANLNQSVGVQATFKWYVELAALAFNNTIDN